MKISQLVLRENFYSILNDTIKKNSFFTDFELNKKKISFKSYHHLNIIFSNALTLKCRNALVHEYTLNPSPLKRVLQRIYVSIVFSPVTAIFFIHKRFKFSENLGKYAIVGGNHRIRLFDDHLKEIIVLLKDGENNKFIKNDIESRIKIKIKYAPKIISHGHDWLIEDFITGVPLNRINDYGLLKKSYEAIIKQHMLEFIYQTKEKTPTNIYIQDTLNGIESQILLIKNNNFLQKQLFKTIKNIENSLLKENLTVIETSMTHGDFQLGNIRISSSNEIIVLDWESADYRFYLYDLFVILGGIRTGISLQKSLLQFFERGSQFDDGLTKYSKNAIELLICLEDLRFNLFEDISLNYFNPGTKSELVAKEIDSIIDI